MISAFFSLQVSLVKSLSKSVQSIDAKLDQQSEEIAEIKLALQRLDRPQMNISHPTPTESPVAPQLEKQTPNILTSTLIEQDSGRGNLHLHYFLLFYFFCTKGYARNVGICFSYGG